MARIPMYEIICSNAILTKDGWIASGELLRVKTENAEQAVWLANQLCKANRSVVLRPDFNETKVSATEAMWYFREWRSFNGEPLKEVRWDLGVGNIEFAEPGPSREPANAVAEALADYMRSLWG